MATGACRVIVHPNAVRFLERAERWLGEREAQYNLVLGIARRLTESTEGFDPPFLFGTVESEAGIEGCLFRTPPHKLGLTSMPLEVMPLVVQTVADHYRHISAVLGPEPVVGAFAREWSRVRSVRGTPGMEQRIYRLDTLEPLHRVVHGAMRPATPADLPSVTSWIEQFSEETGAATRHARDLAQLLIKHEALVLWDDGGCRAMAGTQGFTERGVRISYVYTPDAYRGCGYATALVHALSRKMLADGRDFCVLYADLSNPASNAIYLRIGYEPVEDVRDYHFEAAPA